MVDESETTWFDEKARSFIGKQLVVELTYVDAKGAVESVEDFAGVIERVNLEDGLILRLASSEVRSLPPDLSNLQPAAPGAYPVKSTGEVVQNPDYVAAWTVPVQSPAGVPRWVQVPVGLLLGSFTLLCLLGSLTLVFGGNEKAPILAPIFGIGMSLACLWILRMCFGLVSGRRNSGGLMGPTALRIVAWFFLLLPVGGLFTGYFISRPFQALIQTAAYIAIFFGLRKLANERSASEA
jgi:hypothetical protein